MPASGLYYPAGHFVGNPNPPSAAAVGPINAVELSLSFLRTHAGELGITPGDIDYAVVSRQHSDADTGYSHIYFQQQINRLPVMNTELGVSVAPSGEVMSAAGDFVADVKSKVGIIGSPALSPLDAVRWAAADLGINYQNDAVIASPQMGPRRSQTISFTVTAPSLSTDPITVQLQYVPTPDGGAALTWGMIVDAPHGAFWGEVNVDAASGATLREINYVADADYNALPPPTESPQDGGFTITTNPFNPAASPFGWHDTNGVTGAEFNDTRGNNVDVHLDRNADNIADPSPGRPDGGAALDFSGVTMNPALAPSALTNEYAAQVNLFDMINFLHDMHYMYGFTESAGNFQVNNYGHGGAGNDAVQGDAQDGSGTNNANFGTPADGSSGRMQMFEWTSGSQVRRDGDFDNGVIAHEFGHGVSNRLTGNGSGLGAVQSGGMGEGWGDFYALMITQKTSDTQNAAYPMGTYVLFQSPTGGGIRRRPYSFNMSIDPLTWDAYGTSGTTPYGITRSTEVHNTGELWATTLWDMNWFLINKYGFDSNLMTGWSPNPGPAHAGNKLALRLVMEGMKLQPINPSFTQARDAIIQADINLNGGADLYEIWSAFARRGLGQGSSSGASSSTAQVTLSTTLPMLVSSVVPATGSVVSSHPASYVINLTAPIGIASAGGIVINGQAATGVTFNPGDSFATATFAVDPITAEGNQTIQIAAGTFTRASDNSPVAAFNSNFFYDTTPLTVTSIVPSPGGTVALPLTTIDVNFSGAVDPTSLQNSDLTLSLGSVASVSLVNGNTTARFTISNLTHEQTISLSVAAGAFLDPQGNPNAAFAGGNYTLDYSTFPFPVPLQAQSPLGSMVYSGSFTGTIGISGDTDSFTLALDAGQTANVVVTPNATLQPTLAVTGPGTNQSTSASAAGIPATINGITIGTAGTYTFTVGGVGSTTGSYSIQVVLNLGLEAEANGGPSNDTLATAQDLTPIFVNLGAGLASATLRGRTELPPAAIVSEVEPNGTTATATSGSTYYAIPNNNLYQIGISGAISSSTDADYFNIGTLQAGDVLTLTESGSPSSRGTNADVFVRLYRAGTTAIVTSDDDAGTGLDSLVSRFTITTTDTYYVRAYRANTTNTGTYQLGIWLENSGTAPTTGGTFTAEVEPNESTGTANNASNAWRALPYFATASGTITTGDTDIYSYQFNAGDVVTLITHATSSSLTPQSALLNSAGAAIATEGGDSSVAGAGGYSPIYSYVIPTTGTYYFRVTGASSTTGTYTADIYRSTTASISTVPPGQDLYSFTLAPGQSASAIIKGLAPGNLDLAILDGSGATVATGVAGSTNVDELLSNFVAPAGGTYYLQVSGAPNVDYQVTLTTGGTFDAEPNDSFATAQPLATGRAALGALSGNDDWYQVTLNAGDHLTVATTTPGGAPGEFTNSLDPAVALFDPSNILLASDDNSGPDGRNAKLTFTIASGGVYRIRISAVGGTTGEYTISASVPPRVAAVTVDDGTAQRSRVASLTIRFDQVVSLPANVADAFQLSRNGGGAVNFTATASYQGGVTVVTLNSFTGSEADASGSLIDGRYTLTVLQNRVSSTGAALDGNDDGTAGDNFVYTDAQGLFRFYGDVNGDANINGFDLGIFRNAFGTQVGDANYLNYLDFDQDGVINGLDFGQFRTRFGTTLP